MCVLLTNKMAICHRFLKKCSLYACKFNIKMWYLIKRNKSSYFALFNIIQLHVQLLQCDFFYYYFWIKLVFIHKSLFKIYIHTHHIKLNVKRLQYPLQTWPYLFIHLTWIFYFLWTREFRHEMPLNSPFWPDKKSFNISVSAGRDS